jgi:hypothetical protein
MNNYSDDLKEMTVVQLAGELRKLKELKEAMEEDLKETNKFIEEITKQILPEKMDDQGISNIKIDGVGRITLRGEVYASILAANRDAAYQWLRDTGRASLISNTVNASSLKAACKEWLKNGEQIPEDLIKVTPVTVAVLTRT